ncbi:hypothetical protein FKP32DRAFT_654035 [Trametes sanguinea]|nr:hypothetical protein FKP32DRAFT_654035 [Trametes sanguinea]
MHAYVCRGPRQSQLDTDASLDVRVLSEDHGCHALPAVLQRIIAHRCGSLRRVVDACFIGAPHHPLVSCEPIGAFPPPSSPCSCFRPPHASPLPLPPSSLLRLTDFCFTHTPAPTIVLLSAACFISPLPHPNTYLIRLLHPLWPVLSASPSLRVGGGRGSGATMYYTYTQAFLSPFLHLSHGLSIFRAALVTFCERPAAFRVPRSRSRSAFISSMQHVFSRGPFDPRSARQRPPVYDPLRRIYTAASMRTPLPGLHIYPTVPTLPRVLGWSFSPAVGWFFVSVCVWRVENVPVHRGNVMGYAELTGAWVRR